MLLVHFVYKFGMMCCYSEFSFSVLLFLSTVVSMPFTFSLYPTLQHPRRFCFPRCPWLHDCVYIAYLPPSEMLVIDEILLTLLRPSSSYTIFFFSWSFLSLVGINLWVLGAFLSLVGPSPQWDITLWEFMGMIKPKYQGQKLFLFISIVL